MSSNTGDSGRPTLQPSALGNLVKLDNCPRYFKFDIEEEGLESLNHDTSDYLEAFTGGNILEKKAGNDFEEEEVIRTQPLTSTISVTFRSQKYHG